MFILFIYIYVKLKITFKLLFLSQKNISTFLSWNITFMFHVYEAELISQVSQDSRKCLEHGLWYFRMRF